MVAAVVAGGASDDGGVASDDGAVRRQLRSRSGRAASGVGTGLAMGSRAAGGRAAGGRYNSWSPRRGAARREPAAPEPSMLRARTGGAGRRAPSTSPRPLASYPRRE